MAAIALEARTGPGSTARAHTPKSAMHGKRFERTILHKCNAFPQQVQCTLMKSAKKVQCTFQKSANKIQKKCKVFDLQLCKNPHKMQQVHVDKKLVQQKCKNSAEKVQIKCRKSADKVQIKCRKSAN